MVAVVAVPLDWAVEMLTFLPGFSFRKIGWLHSGQLAALASIAAWQFGHCLFPVPV